VDKWEGRDGEADGLICVQFLCHPPELLSQLPASPPPLGRARSWNALGLARSLAKR